MEWISVKDRLPEEGSDILAYYNDGTEERCLPTNYGCSLWFDCIFNVELNAKFITHWMPTPKPPKRD